MKHNILRLYLRDRRHIRLKRFLYCGTNIHNNSLILKKYNNDTIIFYYRNKFYTRLSSGNIYIMSITA